MPPHSKVGWHQARTSSNKWACSPERYFVLQSYRFLRDPIRTEFAFPRKPYTGNCSCFPHSIQLVAKSDAVFDVRFLGAGGVKTQNDWSTVQDILDRFQIILTSNVEMPERWSTMINTDWSGRAAAMLILTSAFEWTDGGSTVLNRKLRRSMVICYQTQGRRRESGQWCAFIVFKQDKIRWLIPILRWGVCADRSTWGG